MMFLRSAMGASIISRNCFSTSPFLFRSSGGSPEKSIAGPEADGCPGCCCLCSPRSPPALALALALFSPEVPEA
eukprot:CAMPEP_0195133308 /NCGR_PEP_ID=MMETSP0448-20130528/148549_1 /TAXON_ID=66468 /ORGANISM="Heterocapsa triquestra, Strain CCMP 448" /LENGTH=73 /DNA_ID=CAMNT_0040171357 /DNA_START=46 /DNA_END=263 /DNA_ORIENTATION=+